MKENITGETSGVESRTDWEALKRMSDAEVRSGIEADPDAQGTDEAFWEKAQVVIPKNKQIVTMRLDADVLEWFKHQKGYQTRINAILRSYMNAHAQGLRER